MTHKQLDSVVRLGQLPKFLSLKKFMNKTCKKNMGQNMEIQKIFGVSVWDTEGY